MKKICGPYLKNQAQSSRNFSCHSSTADCIHGSKNPGITVITYEHIAVGFFLPVDRTNHVVDVLLDVLVVDFHANSGVLHGETRTNLIRNVEFSLPVGWWVRSCNMNGNSELFKQMNCLIHRH